MSASSYFSDLNDVFNLENSIKENTTFKSKRGILIHIILTNENKSFKKTQNFVTGVGDFHKLIASILRLSLKNVQPKSDRRY